MARVTSKACAVRDGGSARFRQQTASSRVVAGMMAADSGIKNRGFPAACEAITGLLATREVARRIIPDAFRVTADDCALVIYEVDDTNPISREKAGKITALNDELDDSGWTLTVVVLDYVGHEVHRMPGWCFASYYIDKYLPEYAKDASPAASQVTRDSMAPEDDPNWLDTFQMPDMLGDSAIC